MDNILSHSKIVTITFYHTHTNSIGIYYNIQKSVAKNNSTGI